jgi:hypothetical protein
VLEIEYTVDVAVSNDGPPSALPLEECSGGGPVLFILVAILGHFWYLTWQSCMCDGSSSYFVTSLKYMLYHSQHFQGDLSSLKRELLISRNGVCCLTVMYNSEQYSQNDKFSE